MISLVSLIAGWSYAMHKGPSCTASYLFAMCGWGNTNDTPSVLFSKHVHKISQALPIWEPSRESSPSVQQHVHSHHKPGNCCRPAIAKILGRVCLWCWKHFCLTVCTALWTNQLLGQNSDELGTLAWMGAYYVGPYKMHNAENAEGIQDIKIVFNNIQKHIGT